jgi:hypothetical protein
LLRRFAGCRTRREATHKRPGRQGSWLTLTGEFLHVESILSVKDVGFDEHVLTIRREEGGRLVPYVGDKRVAGCLGLTIQSNGEGSMLSMVLEVSKLHFDTARITNTN